MSDDHDVNIETCRRMQQEEFVVLEVSPWCLVFSQTPHDDVDFHSQFTRNV
jgi:hypothetical protein